MMQPVPEALAPESTRGRRLHNFSAGPGALPEEVIEEVRAELPVYDDVGASIMEISHRSPAYDAVHNGAVERMKRLLGLGDGWHVLFLQGGASLQFYQAPLNFLPEGGKADYLVTGSWSKKALKEAKIVAASRGATVNVAASSEDAQFSYIPEPGTWQLDPDAAFLHFTSNNTIYGTQFQDEPEVDVPLVCDASSDFLSRPIAVERYGLIYAGAQKNIGPAGTTAVLVREDFLQRRVEGLPTLLDYRTHVGTLYHTPAVFAVYIVEKVLKWIEANGGLAGMTARNDRKAETLYGAIDATDFYTGTARPDSRSKMNVTFRLPSEELEAKFVKEAKEEGLLALKGYRTVGGIRASIYNAVSQASVDALVDFMRRFEAANG
ncbi:MAG TPA: 3-phosphoserine/phosphohydroxythreonine transaminase [Rubricoccaceae bacterium]|nr:3-phosphoserine/phosphohydroxythreonine transaminase [Rubricoccaceae bacterium]